MTLEQFRSNQSLVEQWADMLRTHALLRLVIYDVMEDAHPTRHAINADNAGDISPTRATLELGFTRGYSCYGDRLRALGVLKSQVNQMPEATYADENKEQVADPS